MSTQYITSIGLFYNNCGILRRVSDCERFSGGCSQEMMGQSKKQSKRAQIMYSRTTRVRGK